jgi:hypothetical protein
LERKKFKFPYWTALSMPAQDEAILGKVKSFVKWDTMKGTYTIEKTGNYFSAAFDWNGVKWFDSEGSIYTFNDTTWVSIAPDSTS